MANKIQKVFLCLIICLNSVAFSSSSILSVDDELKLGSIIGMLRSNRKINLSDDNTNFIIEKLSDHVTNNFLEIIKASNQNLDDIESDDVESFESVYENIIKPKVFNFLVDVFDKEDEELIEEKNTELEMAHRLLCGPCHYVMNKVHYIAKKKIGLGLLKFFVIEACSLFTKRSVCKGAIDMYADVVVDALIDHYVDAELVCTKIKVCPKHFTKLKADDYAREVLKNKPETQEPTFPSSRKLKILHITDTHIDPEYSVGAEGDCPLPYCCRSNAPGSHTHKGKIKSPAGFWGYSGLCDLPLYTFESLITSAVRDIKPDLIVWTGDNDAHDVWEITEETPIKATKLVSSTLNKLVKSPLFPAIGNHEEYPCDMFDLYTEDKKQEFLNRLSNVYSDFIGEEDAKKFSATGFYTKLYNNTKLRIIALNCFLCDAMNFYLIRNPTDPLGQIESLRNALQAAEDSGEKVIIIGHIPPGDYTFLQECNKRYNALIDRYQNIIRGQFFGHTHYDEMRLIHGYFDKSKTVGAVYTAPSVTT